MKQHTPAETLDAAAPATARPAHGPRRRSLRRALPVLAAAFSLLAGCGGGGDLTGSSAAPAGAELSLSYAPDPASSVASADADFDWVARFVMRIQEQRGVGVALLAIELGVSSDDAARRLLDAAAIARLAGTSRLAPGGRVDIPIELAYRAPSRSTDILVRVTARDDRGRSIDIRGGLPVR